MFDHILSRVMVEIALCYEEREQGSLKNDFGGGVILSYSSAQAHSILEVEGQRPNGRALPSRTFLFFASRARLKPNL